jgi:hypothetical protein
MTGCVIGTRTSRPKRCCKHALAHLVDVARRAPTFPLQPEPAVLAPVQRLVVAAVLDELAVLGPGDGLRIDLELGQRDLVRRAARCRT